MIGTQYSFPHPQPLSHCGEERGALLERFPLSSRAGEGAGGEGMLAVVHAINHDT